MKKKVIALLMAAVLIGTNGGFAELGSTVVHAAESCGTKETDHKNVTAAFKWKTDKTCVATFACDDCDYEVEKKCTVNEAVSKAATCTADGEIEYTATATFAGKPYEQKLVDTIAATGHTKKVTKEAKAATCTEDGWTEEVTCSTCKVVLTESKTSKATGHKEKIVAGKDATCTENGYTDETICSVCDAVLKESEVIPAAHDYAADEFEWNGYSECIANIYCKKCDISVEVECKTIVLTKVDPTCTEDGYDLYTATCTYEGQEFTSTKMGDESSVKQKLGHHYVDDFCTRCGLEKPTSEIVFVKDKTTTTYSGEKIKVSEDICKVVKGSGKVTFEYYLDEACTVPTYMGDERKEATAPVEAGVYFVKALVEADDEYKANDTDGIHKLIIRPERVSSLKAVNNKSTIKLTWTKNKQASGYIIYRKTDETEYEVYAYIEDASTVSFTDDLITQGTKYRYNIVAYKIAECGEEAKSLMRKTGTNIVRTKVTLTNQNGSVRVKWTKVKDAAGYKLYRKCSGEDKYTLIKNLSGESSTAYTDKSSKVVRNGKASYYYIVPYYENSSNVVLKTCARTNYYMDRSEVTSLTTSGSKALRVEWESNPQGNGYQIRYSRNSNMENAKTITVASKTTLSKKISELVAGKTYYVQVRAYKTYKDVKYYSGWSAKKSKKTK